VYEIIIDNELENWAFCARHNNYEEHNSWQCMIQQLHWS